MGRLRRHFEFPAIGNARYDDNNIIALLRELYLLEIRVTYTVVHSNADASAGFPLIIILYSGFFFCLLGVLPHVFRYKRRALDASRAIIILNYCSPRVVLAVSQN